MKSQFANVRGRPGEGARLIGLVRFFIPLVVIAIATGYLLGTAFPFPLKDPVTLSVAFGLLALAGILSVRLVGNRVARYLKGAQGEELAARILGFLPNDFTVYHSLSLSGSQIGDDLDHVLASPRGIFVIETKNWKGQITVENGEILYDGQRPTRPPLEQVYNGARQLRDQLHAACENAYYEVIPILCFVDNRVTTGAEETAGVLVCDDTNLMETILSHADDTIRREDLDQIHQVLERGVFNV